MGSLETIAKTREYLEYLEEHVINVKKAWGVLKEKCKNENFIYDDFLYHTIDSEIEWHDISKLSEAEFIQYRKAFFSTESEKKEGKYDMSEAWNHHKNNNPHHWENWTNNRKPESGSPRWVIDCVHMVCDWMAMGYKFGDTAKEYYEKNKEKIELPGFAVDFIYEIFEAIERE